MSSRRPTPGQGRVARGRAPGSVLAQRCRLVVLRLVLGLAVRISAHTADNPRSTAATAALDVVDERTLLCNAAAESPSNPHSRASGCLSQIRPKSPNAKRTAKMARGHVHETERRTAPALLRKRQRVARPIALRPALRPRWSRGRAPCSAGRCKKAQGAEQTRVNAWHARCPAGVCRGRHRGGHAVQLPLIRPQRCPEVKPRPGSKPQGQEPSSRPHPREWNP